MDIIYKNTSEVIVSNTSKDLCDCKIYVPTGLSFDMVHLCIKSNIVVLKRATSDKSGYDMYCIGSPNFIDIKNGCYDVYVIGIKLNTASVYTMPVTKINIEFDNYNQTALSANAIYLGADIHDKYSKIVKLTELCSKIYMSTKELINNE